MSETATEAVRTWSESEEEALRLWIALARCYLTFSREVSSQISEYGLTSAQFGVMEALHHVGPMPLGELAGKLLVTGGNVTYVMDRLEQQGLVERVRSAEDRRVVTAELTDEGRRIIDEYFPGHASFIEGLTDSLTPDERTQLRGLLKKLGKGITAESSGAS